MKNNITITSLILFFLISAIAQSQIPSLGKAKNLGNNLLHNKKKKDEEKEKPANNSTSIDTTNKQTTTKPNADNSNSGSNTNSGNNANGKNNGTTNQKSEWQTFSEKREADRKANEAKELQTRTMPIAKMKDAKIEKDFMTIIKDDFNEPITSLRAVIDQSDWYILRNDLGVITGRTLPGYVAFKVTRNGYCFYKKITIYQSYTGGGNYGKSQYYDTRVSTDLVEIKCENVSK